MRTNSRLLLALSLSAAILAGTAIGAAAQDCVTGCVSATRACVVGARSELLACRADCQGNAAPEDLRACLWSCRQTFYAAKATCREDAAGCLDSCAPVIPGDPELAACLGACGQDLGTCAQGVLSTAKGCVAGCETAGDRWACLGACATDAKAGGLACGETFSVCTSECTGSPTTTLPQPLCFQAGAPACGGTCILPGLACAAVGPERCGCVLAN